MNCDNSIPLYLGIPLALICTAVALLLIVFAIYVWKDRP